MDQSEKSIQESEYSRSLTPSLKFSGMDVTDDVLDFEDTLLDEPPLAETVVEEITIDDSIPEKTDLKGSEDTLLDEPPLAETVVEEITIDDTLPVKTDLRGSEDTFLNEPLLAETVVEEITIEDSPPEKTDLRGSESGGQVTVAAHFGSSATEIGRKESKRDIEGISNHSVPRETQLSDNGSGGQMAVVVHSVENRKESESEGGKEDLEDGEICESSEGGSDCNFICRYYQRGLCSYGMNCRFLHLTEKGHYDMFDEPAQTFARHFVKPNLDVIISHSVELETEWDRALKEAMERVKMTARRKDDADSRKPVGESVRSPSYGIRGSSLRASSRYEVEAVGSVSLEKNISGQTKFRLNCRYSWRKSRTPVSDSSRSSSRCRHSSDRYGRKRGRSPHSPSKKIRRRLRSSSSKSSSSSYSREKFRRWKSRERRSSKGHRSHQARSSLAAKRPADIHGKTCRLSPKFREKKVPSSSAKSLQSVVSVVSSQPRCRSKVVSDCRPKTVPSADRQRRLSDMSLSPSLETSKSSWMSVGCHRSPSDMSISSLSDVPEPEVFSCPLETETSRPSSFETRDVRLTSQMSSLQTRDNRPTTKSSSLETEGSRLMCKSSISETRDNRLTLKISSLEKTDFGLSQKKTRDTTTPDGLSQRLEVYGPKEAEEESSIARKEGFGIPKSSISETRDNRLTLKISSLEKTDFGLSQKKTRETTTPDGLSRRLEVYGPKEAEEESSIARKEGFGIPKCSQSELNDCRKSVASSRNSVNAKPKKGDPLLVDLMKYHGNSKGSRQRLVEQTPGAGPECPPARNVADKRGPESSGISKNDDKRPERKSATAIRKKKKEADVAQRPLSRKEYLIRYLRQVDAAIRKKTGRGQK